MAEATLTTSDEARTRLGGTEGPQTPDLEPAGGAGWPTGTAEPAARLPQPGVSPDTGALPGGGAFGDVASGIMGAAPAATPTVDQQFGLTQDAAQKVIAGLNAKAAAVAPLFQGVEVAAQQQAEAIRRGPIPPPLLPPPPSGNLHGFLDPVEGEDPVQSVNKLLQAVGLFAIGIGGAARGNVKSGLSAFIGAMTGWSEGDRDRADREVKKWERESERALKQWEIECKGYEDILTAANTTLATALKRVEIKALEMDNQLLADVAAKGDAAATLQFLAQRETHAQDYAAKMAKVLQEAQDNATREERLRQEGEANRTVQREGQAITREGHLLTAAGQEAARIETARHNRAQEGVAQGTLDLARQKAAQGEPTPGDSMKTLRNVAMGQGQVNEITRLASDKTTVDLNKVMGGMRPAINQWIQQGKAGPLPLGILPAGLMGTLTPNEQRLVAIMSDYADSIGRARSGQNIGAHEMERLEGFLITPSLTPDAFRTRLQLAADTLAAQQENELGLLKATNHMAPRLPPATLGQSGNWAVVGVKP